MSDNDPMKIDDLQQHYSEASFWEKLRNFANSAGKQVVERALQLYYASKRPDTPTWAKTVVYSALAYFILPADAIPDLVPIVGYADDLGALTAALATLAMYVNTEVKQQASDRLRDWFGD